jgi:hypothetical protein
MTYDQLDHSKLEMTMIYHRIVSVNLNPDRINEHFDHGKQKFQFQRSCSQHVTTVAQRSGQKCKTIMDNEVHKI